MHSINKLTKQDACLQKCLPEHTCFSAQHHVPSSPGCCRLLASHLTVLQPGNSQLCNNGTILPAAFKGAQNYSGNSTSQDVSLQSFEPHPLALLSFMQLSRAGQIVCGLNCWPSSMHVSAALRQR